MFSGPESIGFLWSEVRREVMQFYIVFVVCSMPVFFAILPILWYPL